MRYCKQKEKNTLILVHIFNSLNNFLWALDFRINDCAYSYYSELQIKKNQLSGHIAYPLNDVYDIIYFITILKFLSNNNSITYQIYK